MVFKLSVALVGALAVVAQAGYARRHVQQHKSLSYSNNQTTSVAETSSTVANSPETTSNAPLETFPTFTPESSTPVYGTPSSSVVPTLPLTTAPSGTSDNSPAPISGNHTLTYTLGTGSSTTVVTTTILETSTKTNINTIYATSDSEASATGGAGGDNELTTTITSTSTSTIYKTIKPTSSGIVDNSPVGAPGSSKCPVPVTVTVTGSPVTVTVTAGSGSGESPESTQTPISSSAPYPISSKTTKTKTKCPTASTGFITKPYPTFTSQPSADITFPHPTSIGAVGYM
ncbi:MAG: hypothetical protein L6R42_010423 [Xanthoria sp. 1 TBL-2021]|nr:MAG: hypothetical protein L6R42_010423 [Xanthoria sp. 1 TBL-2021]